MTAKPFNDTFLKACRQEPTDHVPVWYMRQAGRYQPEYRAIRAKHTFFEMNYIPEVCAEVTRLPVEQLGVDAAILFADIMTPLKPIGVDVNIESGIGPVIANPIGSLEDVHRLGELDPDTHVPYIMEAIKILRQQLSVPLIGFAGAPFTLASYMIEGGPSKHYHKTKSFMYTQPAAWEKLMEKLGTLTITYLKAQIAAGAQAVQVFDSWVGALNDEDYRTFIAPVMNRILLSLRETGVPTIYFGVGCGHLLEEWNKLPVDVVGLDWRTSITKARELGVTKTLQGNLDPTLLLAPWEKLEAKAKEILDEGTQQPGYIFNLGHGVFPDAKVETLQKLTSFIHSYRRNA
ncbi:MULTISPECIES: uroporphyrinogen decarboxylase [Brevibacillus]|uniref:uroporphyrinogen decarboxylase n=1 Tax=Brevibacillus TaxID=55080 RepID=UPI0004695747|nr:uroporphyrinogen decarboxylase [Brevibacillus borstelensis]KKX55760.1 uroporphyrinogen decarboxylase [Brevibacillus borstelensis cifa_chp40]MBE5394609.1 uroporphyrinogen decarboxylase [Brevibacillus borstelensis]MCC0564989.1 uroporphyrinogen decarboxylase [Brevibacillus borstelensis]MCM3470614.1 uroporphyrinogen decarboxylase [Brevibacillus borstelensis]MCM3559043.1 uroporphyrinogen decarboxylase [Brevibacillus borstelensis]